MQPPTERIVSEDEQRKQHGEEAYQMSTQYTVQRYTSCRHRPPSGAKVECADGTSSLPADIVSKAPILDLKTASCL